jgi:hypothetical protein
MTASNPKARPRRLQRRILRRHGLLPRVKKEMSRAIKLGVYPGRPDGWRIAAGQRQTRMTNR